MKSLTKKSLDELAKIMPVIGETEQRSFIGGEAPSGSNTQPYTWEEYESMVASGHWNGGYVVGTGYVAQKLLLLLTKKSPVLFQEYH